MEVLIYILIGVVVLFSPVMFLVYRKGVKDGLGIKKRDAMLPFVSVEKEYDPTDEEKEYARQIAAWNNFHDIGEDK